ncbi:MAG: hypothetical protein U0531_20975 [Dehalococcoidia bacterium]
MLHFADEARRMRGDQEILDGRAARGVVFQVAFRAHVRLPRLRDHNDDRRPHQLGAHARDLGRGLWPAGSRNFGGHGARQRRATGAGQDNETPWFREVVVRRPGRRLDQRLDERPADGVAPKGRGATP